MIRPVYALAFLLAIGAVKVPDLGEAEDMLTCLNLFYYHSPRLLSTRPQGNSYFREFALNYIDLCKSQLALSEYTKVVTHIGGVPTPLFPQEQYLSLKLG